MTNISPWRRRGEAATSLFDQLLPNIDQFLAGTPFARSGDVTPRIDVYETQEDLRVEVELPGVAENDLSVTLEEGALVIAGEKRAEHSESRAGWLRSERVYGAFRRVVPLPWKVAEEDVRATFRQGVLEVRLPKGPEARTRSIRIERGGAE